MEQEFIAASGQGLEAILVIRGTPDWAQAVPGYPCGPVQSEQLGTFAAWYTSAIA